MNGDLGLAVSAGHGSASNRESSVDAIQSLIVPVDFSDPSRAAVRYAIAIAKLDGASIHLVHALRFPLLGSPYEALVPDAVWRRFHEEASGQIEGLRKQVEASGIASVTTEIAESSDPVALVAQAVERHAADLIVMGTHGYSGIKHTCLGSVTERTIRKLACPVLAVNDPDNTISPVIERILVPVDFSAHSDEAAACAGGLAARLGASIDLLHAIDFVPEDAAYLTPDALEIDREMQATARERLTELAESITGTGVRVESHLLRGKPAAVIEAIAERLASDLIVMGSHGHTGLSERFIGSVTERTLRVAECSVLAVKADDDRTGRQEDLPGS
jgi:nucleotide-binding universal stress UspA family protein